MEYLNTYSFLSLLLSPALKMKLLISYKMYAEINKDRYSKVLFLLDQTIVSKLIPHPKRPFWGTPTPDYSDIQRGVFCQCLYY